VRADLPWSSGLTVGNVYTIYEDAHYNALSDITVRVIDDYNDHWWISADAFRLYVENPDGWDMP
jgi:hypothetical protein